MVDLVGTDRIWVVFVEQVKKKAKREGINKDGTEHALAKHLGMYLTAIPDIHSF